MLFDDDSTLADLSFVILVPGTAKFTAQCGQDQASHDVMAEFSKWLKAGEESIFSLETEKNLPGASCELPESAARTENSQNKIPDGL